MTAPRRIAHGRVSLALWELRLGPPAEQILLLHELGTSARAWSGSAWPGDGSVHALDLAGHGASGDRPGRAYTPELFAADADAALAALGPCRVVGAGLGAYVALLVAGARPDLVTAAVLLPGAGLDGGGDAPSPVALATFADDARRFDRGRSAAPDDAAHEPAARDDAAHDPAVLACARDVRPPDYARDFALAARRLVLVEDGGTRPGWWSAVRGVPAARVTGSLAEALRVLSASA